jgi:hypothetical protein
MLVCTIGVMHCVQAGSLSLTFSERLNAEVRLLEITQKFDQQDDEALWALRSQWFNRKRMSFDYFQNAMREVRALRGTECVRKTKAFATSDLNTDDEKGVYFAEYFDVHCSHGNFVERMHLSLEEGRWMLMGIHMDGPLKSHQKPPLKLPGVSIFDPVRAPI